MYKIIYLTFLHTLILSASSEQQRENSNVTEADKTESKDTKEIAGTEVNENSDNPKETNNKNSTEVGDANDVTEVTVYAEENYQGEAYVLQPRGYLISEIEKFKSIKIPTGYEVLFSDMENYESNNNQSYSKSIPIINTAKYKYFYIAKIDETSNSGLANREEYNENTHEYIGVGITSLKILGPNVEKITIDNATQFTGLGNITQYKKLQFIRYNASSGSTDEVFHKDMNSIFEFLDKTTYLKDIELVGEHQPFSICRNGKFLGVNIKSLSEIPEDTTEIYLIDCNKIQDASNLRKYTSLKKLFMYGTTFALADWKSILSTIDTLSISGKLTHVQLPPSFVGEITKSQRVQGRKIEYFGALGAMKIASEGFQCCPYLREVYFPRVKTIDSWGFYKCNNLTIVNMPQCEYINQNAFECNKNLQEVKFKNATKIGEKAFYQCNQLSLVDMPNVQEIGKSAFETCASLKKFGDLSKIEKDNVFYAPKLMKVGDYAFKMTDASGQTTIEEVILPECISVGKESFSRWRSMKKLNLPKCRTIATEGFYDPYNLSDLSLPEVEFIDARAFVYNKDEKISGTLELPKVKTIGSCAFGGSNFAHPNITAINAPECTNMSDDAFRGNVNIKSISSNCDNKIAVLQQSKSRL